MRKINYRLFDRSNAVNPIKATAQTLQETAEDTNSCFAPKAARGEFFTFQIGISALCDIEELRIVSDLQNTSVIEGFTAFHQEGTDAYGNPFTKQVPMAQNECRIFWCGFFVNETASKGSYPLMFSLQDGEACLAEISFTLEVSEDIIENHGFDDIENHSRLQWLNSDIGIDHEITKPYTEIVLEGNTISILGRKLVISSTGMIEQVFSEFESDNSILNPQNQKPLFTYAPSFCVGDILARPKSSCLRFTHVECDCVSWIGTSEFSDYTLVIEGSLEYDGYMSSKITVCPKTDFDAPVVLEFPYAEKYAKYMLGLGFEGGHTPISHSFKWDAEKQQDSVFIGSVNIGMQLQLKDRNYRKPHVNIYYHNNPLSIPDCWNNNGAGGISVTRDENLVKLSAFSGKRSFYKNRQEEYRFDCIFTPLKTINWKERWENRYYHKGDSKNRFEELDKAVECASTVVNIHHAGDTNPFINYPFFESERLKKLVDEAHEKGLKLKPYYTCRELTNRIPEIFPFLTLEDEIYPFFTGKTKGVPFQGGNDSWITQNLTDERVITAWKAVVSSGKFTGETCASIIVNSQSRLANFYMEGLNWLLKKIGIDGIYIDDTGLDRFALRRVRKILDANKDGCLIDFHSWNHFEDQLGAGNGCNMNLFMSLFPYMNSIWFGEGFDYFQKPEYYLTAISGIMYGIPGELIDEPGVNNYKGLIYGMTNRPYGQKEKSPTPLWKFLLKEGIENSTLLGYWDEQNPFQSNCEEVPVSAYRMKEHMLIVITNFSDSVHTVEISTKLSGISYEIPYIEGYQEAASFNCNEALTLQANQGIIVRCTL